VFKQVRSEVAQVSGGRQIPWTASSVVGDFSFSQGRGEATNTTENQTRTAVGDRAKDDERRGGGGEPPVISTSQVAPLPQGEGSRGQSGVLDVKDQNVLAELDLAFWKSIEPSQDAEDFQLYLNKFPTGVFRDLAVRRIEDYRLKVRVESQLARIMQQPNQPSRAGDRSIQAPVRRSTAQVPPPPTPTATTEAASKYESDMRTKQLADQVAELKDREARMYDFGKWCFTTLVALVLGVMGMMWANLKNLVPAKTQSETPKVAA